MKKRIVKPCFEPVSQVEHKEHQVVNTRVSYYMRMYATGKITEFPTNGLVQNKELPEDLRNDLLNRNLPLPERGTDPVEIMNYLTANRERFENLKKEFELAQTDLKRYNEAMRVLDDKNSDHEAISNAMAVIDAIEKKARARAV